MSEPACYWSMGEGVPSQLAAVDASPSLPGKAILLEEGDLVCDTYRVVGVLGRGGSGVVYRAREPGTERDVAIKLLAPNCDPVLQERLLREGQTVAALQHPGIGRVFSAGHWQGQPFLVYELLEGCRTLEQAFSSIPRAELLGVVQQIGEALGHAHAHGVVHRDVKPENVLLDQNDAPRLIDFGHARSSDQSRLTTEGALIGTPLYMAPETYEDSSGSPRADVWSLGVILFRALSGRLPFDSPSLLELAAQICSPDPERLRSLCPDMPAPFAAIALRALEVEAGDRYPDAGAMAEDLRRALAGLPLAERDRRTRVAPLVGGVLVVGVCGLALALAERPTSAPTETPTAVVPLEEQVEDALELGRATEASRLLDALREARPGPPTEILAARVAAALGEDPLPVLEAAAKSWPDSPRFAQERIDLEVRRGALPTALRIAEEVSRTWPRDVATRVGALEELARDTPRADRLQDLPPSWVAPTSRWLLDQITLDLTLLAELTAPQSWVRRRGRPDPTHGGAGPDARPGWFLELGLQPSQRLARASARLDAMRDWPLKPGLAADLREAAERLDAHHATPAAADPVSPQIRRQTGALLRKAGAHDGARERYVEGHSVDDLLEEALALDPRCWPAEYFRARNRFLAGEHEQLRGCVEATRRCPKLIRHLQYDLRVWNTLNGAQAFGELRSLFEGEDPEDALVHLTLSASIVEFTPSAGDAPAAWQEAEAYLERDPGSLLARTLRAFLALRTRRLDVCRFDLKLLREVLVQAPSAEFVRALLLMHEGSKGGEVLAALRAAKRQDYRAFSGGDYSELSAGLYPECEPYLGLEGFQAFFGP